MGEGVYMLLVELVLLGMKQYRQESSSCYGNYVSVERPLRRRRRQTTS